MQVIDWLLLSMWVLWWWGEMELTEQAYLNCDSHFEKQVIFRNCLFEIWKNLKKFQIAVIVLYRKYIYVYY